MADNSGNKGAWAKERPDVSVIMPAYNCTKTIGKAVDSVLAQDEVSLELIVISDCSTDNLDEVMRPYESDARVRYIKNSANLGAAKTRNRGVKQAKGRYTAFLDADDWWEKGKLKAQLELMQKTGTALSSTSRRLVDEGGRDTGRVITVPEKITYRKLLHHNCINCSSVMLKTRVAREFPMEHEESHEDYITWLRILKKYGSARGLASPYLNYRLTGKGKSGSKWKSAKMTYEVYRIIGFGRILSTLLFIRYACNGVWKYYFR